MLFLLKVTGSTPPNDPWQSSLYFLLEFFALPLSAPLSISSLPFALVLLLQLLLSFFFPSSHLSWLDFFPLQFLLNVTRTQSRLGQALESAAGSWISDKVN